MGSEQRNAIRYMPDDDHKRWNRLTQRSGILVQLGMPPGHRVPAENRRAAAGGADSPSGMGPNRRAQKRERAAAETATKAKHAEAYRKAIGEAQKIVAI